MKIEGEDETTISSGARSLPLTGALMKISEYLETHG